MRVLFLLIFVNISVISFGQQKSLDYFLTAALKNSPFILGSSIKIDSLKIDSAQIKSRYKANVSFDSHNVYAPIVNGYGYDQAITNGGNVTALVGVNLPIVGKENKMSQFRNIYLQMQSQYLLGQLNERDLKKSITSQYIVVLGEQIVVTNNEKIIDVINDEEKILKQLTEDGVYSQTDYLTFLVEMKQQELAVEQQKLQLKNDLALMNYSCGIVDTSFSVLTDPGLKKHIPQQIENTLTVKQYIIDSLALKNQFDQIKFDYRPQFNLFGDAGYNSSLNYKGEKNFGASAGFHVFVPIYDGNIRRLRSQRLKLSENARIIYLNFYKVQFTQEELRLEQQMLATDQLLSTIDQQIKLSEALIDADKKLLVKGNLRITDYLFAIKNYFSIKSSEAQLSNAKVLLINEYNYLNY